MKALFDLVAIVVMAVLALKAYEFHELSDIPSLESAPAVEAVAVARAPKLLKPGVSAVRCKTTHASLVDTTPVLECVVEAEAVAGYSPQVEATLELAPQAKLFDFAVVRRESESTPYAVELGIDRSSVDPGEAARLLVERVAAVQSKAEADKGTALAAARQSALRKAETAKAWEPR